MLRPARLRCLIPLALLSLAACGGHPEPPAAGKRPGGAAIPVTVATARQQSVPVTLTAIGNVEPLASVAIKSRVDGQIVEVLVQDGQDVHKGQPLFQIDPRPFQVLLQQAQANLARDKALLEIATSQEARYRDLLAQHYVSPDNYAQVKGNLDSATAAVQTDEGAIASAKLQLDFASIRAPINGRLGRITLQRGNLVKANDTAPLVTLNQLDPIYVSFNVPEQQLAGIRAAMSRSRLAVTAQHPDSNDVQHGKLSFIDNAVDAATGTIRLRARFDNPDHPLWPGQFVSVVLDLGEQDQALAIPTDAVQTGPKGPYVYVVKPDSTVELRELAIGRNTDRIAVVTRGLSSGDRVVVDGQSRLAPGSRVTVAGQGESS